MKNNITILYILKQVDSSVIFIDLPDFVQSANFYASNDSDNDETSQHNDRLKYVCPNNRLEATLKNTNICIGSKWVSTLSVSSALFIYRSLTAIAPQSYRSHAAVIPKTFIKSDRNPVAVFSQSYAVLPQPYRNLTAATAQAKVAVWINRLRGILVQRLLCEAPEICNYSWSNWVLKRKPHFRSRRLLVFSNWGPVGNIEVRK